MALLEPQDRVSIVPSPHTGESMVALPSMRTGKSREQRARAHLTLHFLMYFTFSHVLYFNLIYQYFKQIFIYNELEYIEI